MQEIQIEKAKNSPVTEMTVDTIDRLRKYSPQIERANKELSN
jgi:hypothetical protein